MMRVGFSALVDTGLSLVVSSLSHPACCPESKMKGMLCERKVTLRHTDPDKLHFLSHNSELHSSTPPPSLGLRQSPFSSSIVLTTRLPSQFPLSKFPRKNVMQLKHPGFSTTQDNSFLLWTDGCMSRQLHGDAGPPHL